MLIFWRKKLQKFIKFVQQVDEIICFDTVDFQYIKAINLRTVLQNVNIVANRKINSGLFPSGKFLMPMKWLFFQFITLSYSPVDH